MFDLKEGGHWLAMTDCRYGAVFSVAVSDHYHHWEAIKTWDTHHEIMGTNPSLQLSHLVSQENHIWGKCDDWDHKVAGCELNSEYQCSAYISSGPEESLGGSIWAFGPCKESRTTVVAGVSLRLKPSCLVISCRQSRISIVNDLQSRRCLFCSFPSCYRVLDFNVIH